VGSSAGLARSLACHHDAVSGFRCEIFPSDLDATVRFYTEVLGFVLVHDDRSAASPYVVLQFEQLRLGAARRSEVPDVEGRRPPTGVELVLECDDLQAARDRVLRCGWPIETDLVAQPWGLLDFRVLDPSGYYWRLTGSP
jgi:lactoylglutathione lyase